MLHSKQQKNYRDGNHEKDRLGTTTKRTLMVPKAKYSRLLRRDCKHSNYLKAFYTLRKQDEDFLESSPTFEDFIVGTDTFQFDLPYPIVKPYIVDDNIDTCAEIFEERSKYYAKLKNYIYYYKKDQKWLTKAYLQKTKYGKLPKYMIDLTTGNVRNPDEEFEGIYNWYYTGGTLSKFHAGDKEYLVYPLPNNDIRIVNVDSYSDDVHTIEMNRLNFNFTPILNLTAQSDNSGNNVLTIRQRNSINVYSLLGNNNFSLLPIYKVATKDKNPLLDVKSKHDEIAYLDYNRKLNIVNLDDEKSKSFKFKKTDDELSDGFCQLEYLNENSIGFIDRNTLRFLDIRSFDEQTLDMRDKLFLCDDLCYVKHLNGTPYLFLATIHNIKKVDLRTRKVVKVWSHMLAGQPSMVKIEIFPQGCIIFLSSEKHNERIILCSKEDESNLVQLVPNNYDTFKKCNILDFDLNSSLYEGRLKFSTTGIETAKNKNNVSLYTCNALGDIFQTNMSKFKEATDLSFFEFKNWRQHFERKPSPYIVTHLRDMSNAKFILRKPTREDALKKYTKPNKKRLEYIAENTIEGSAFAHIWVYDENAANVSLAPSISATSKVSDWLEGVNSELNDEE